MRIIECEIQISRLCMRTDHFVVFSLRFVFLLVVLLLILYLLAFVSFDFLSSRLTSRCVCVCVCLSRAFRLTEIRLALLFPHKCCICRTKMNVLPYTLGFPFQCCCFLCGSAILASFFIYPAVHMTKAQLR